MKKSLSGKKARLWVLAGVSGMIVGAVVLALDWGRFTNESQTSGGGKLQATKTVRNHGSEVLSKHSTKTARELVGKNWRTERWFAAVAGEALEAEGKAKAEGVVSRHKLALDLGEFEQFANGKVKKFVIDTGKGSPLLLEGQRRNANVIGGWSVSGAVAGYEGSYFVASIYEDAVTMSVQTNDEKGGDWSVRVNPKAEGFVLTELDYSAMPRSTCGTCTGCAGNGEKHDLAGASSDQLEAAATGREDIVAERAEELAPSVPVVSADSKGRGNVRSGRPRKARKARVGVQETVVKVLVLYTEEMEKILGGRASVKAVYGNAQRYMNDALENSKVSTPEHVRKIKIVDGHKMRDFDPKLSDYEETERGMSAEDAVNRVIESMKSSLYRFSIAKEVENLRKRHGADLVSLAFLIKDSQNGRGKAKINGHFSVIGVPPDNLSLFKMTFTHELAHSFGCRHNIEHDGKYDKNRTPAAGTYNYGWRWRDLSGACRTIMSYGSSFKGIPYFSNPNVKYIDLYPTGTAQANNARFLRENFEKVSKKMGKPLGVDGELLVTDAKSGVQVLNEHSSDVKLRVNKKRTIKILPQETVVRKFNLINIGGRKLNINEITINGKPSHPRLTLSPSWSRSSFKLGKPRVLEVTYRAPLEFSEEEVSINILYEGRNSNDGYKFTLSFEGEKNRVTVPDWLNTKPTRTSRSVKSDSPIKLYQGYGRNKKEITHGGTIFLTKKRGKYYHDVFSIQSKDGERVDLNRAETEGRGFSVKGFKKSVTLKNRRSKRFRIVYRPSRNGSGSGELTLQALTGGGRSFYYKIKVKVDSPTGASVQRDSATPSLANTKKTKRAAAARRKAVRLRKKATKRKAAAERKAARQAKNSVLLNGPDEIDNPEYKHFYSVIEKSSQNALEVQQWKITPKKFFSHSNKGLFQLNSRPRRKINGKIKAKVSYGGRVFWVSKKIRITP